MLSVLSRVVYSITALFLFSFELVFQLSEELYLLPACSEFIASLQAQTHVILTYVSVYYIFRVFIKRGTIFYQHIR